MDAQTGQQLIDAFFKALGLSELERCQELLHALDKLAERAPEYRSWHIYLAGVMANELRHDWAEGERIFTALLATDLEISLRGRVLIALGRTYDYQGRWSEAIEIYKQCLTVFDAPDQAIDRAKIWKNAAITLQKGFARGDLSDAALQHAITYCQLGLDALHALAQPNAFELWLTATTWNTLGVVYFSLGEDSLAIDCYQRCIALGRSLEDDYDIGMASNNLGEVLQRQGPERWAEAQRAYQEALTIYRAFGNQYEEIDALCNLAFLHQEMGETNTALDYYTQAITVIEDLRAGVSADVARAGFFATVADTYANAALLYVDTGDAARAFEIVERARSRAFLDTLAAGSPDLPERVEMATLTLAEAQAALPADALLLAYFTTGLVEAKEGRAAPGAQRHRFPPARTLIFAITRDTVQVHDAGLSPNDLRPSRLDSAVERHFLRPDIRRTLYDRLIAPAESLLHGWRWLYLAPHGPLHYIPFQALIAPDGDTLLRKDGPQLVYGPSATVLFRHGRVTSGRAPEPCLALGYNGEETNRLRFAEEEARGVARLAGGRALAGPAPKKAALFEQAAGYRLLHLSCHGRFDPDSPLSSALHLALGEDLTAAEVIERLRLRCDLVALSACESGLSRVRRGDELVGLARAFMLAGAPALIATLWKVDERSTRILMERFYQEAHNGVGFAEALKRAQLYLMRLTRQEAEELLVHLMTEDLFDPAALLASDAQDHPSLLALEHGRAYLKSLPAAGAAAAALPGGPSDLIFADPYFWAPFILIGEHGSD